MILLEKMGETYLILKNWRNKIVWKIFDIKVSARGNQDDFSVKLFVATFASWQNFQLLDTKRDLKFQHQGYKRLFDEKKQQKWRYWDIQKYGDESSSKISIPKLLLFWLSPIYKNSAAQTPFSPQPTKSVNDEKLCKQTRW